MASREDRFRAVFDVAHPALTAYARRRVPPDEVEDLVAETLLVAWRRLDDVPADAPLPWLYGVARNVRSNARRGARRRGRLLERLVAQPAIASRAHGSLDTSTPIGAAFESLGGQDQEVLALAAWEGLRPAEIATVLGCTPNAAALRLSRARRRLRRALTGSAVTRTSAPVEGRHG